MPRGTVTYVSLSDVIQAFGGRISSDAERIQIDLSGVQAWLKVDQTSVNSSLQSFDLRQPVLTEGTSVLVAATDVRSLLSNGFGVRSEQRVNREVASRASPLGMSVDELTGARQDSSRAGRSASRPVKTEIRVAIIDPGHGGEDSGHVQDGVKEKDIALSVAVRVRAALEKTLGIQVRLLRDDDLRLSNPQRVTLANRDAGDVLVSLHVGASRSSLARGFGVFHSVPQAGLDARAIARSLSDALVAATDTPSLHVRQARLAVFRDLEMPAVLVEMGHLSNPADAALLVDEAYQEKLAGAIATGLAPFVKAAPVTPEAS